MRASGIRVLAVAALAFTSIATPTLAGSPYYHGEGEAMAADQAGMMGDRGMMARKPRARGQFSCSFNERRTRLQRRACGATKNVY